MQTWHAFYYPLQTMEGLVAPIAMESQRHALEHKPENATEHVKRPAPSAGGCRIEGYVRVKKVNLPFCMEINEIDPMVACRYAAY